MDILAKIPILTSESVSQFQLEDAALIHKSFTADNPQTYKLFLTKRPDLSPEDVSVYQRIIRRLEENEKIKYEIASKSMKTYQYSDSVTRGTTKYHL